jgi:cytochrome oxidase Cu insertion factor (SCO1/SenC/PrrC family)
MLRKIFGLVAVLALLTVAAFSQAQPAAQPAQPAAKPPAIKTHLKVGDKAPDFMLVGVDGKNVQLKKLKGKTNVVLAFYPKAFSGG